MTADPVATVTAWARGLGPGRRVVLHCAASGPGHPSAASDDVVRWASCVRTLSAAELAELVAASPRLLLGIEGCQCGTATSASDTPPAVHLLAPVLAQLGAADRLQVGTDADKAADPAQGRSGRRRTGSRGPATVGTLPVGRRALFAWAAPHPGTPAAPHRRPPEPASGHGEADEQVRLAQALREIRRQVGDPAVQGQPVHGPAPRSRQLASTGCTACSTCVRSCPTGALDLIPVDPGSNGPASDSWHLTADLSACIGCGRCLALCPVSALSDEGPMSWAELAAAGRTVLETVAVRTCRRCRTPFGGEGELCQVCRMRQGNPFGSWLPPGYVAPRVYAPPRSETEDDA